MPDNAHAEMLLASKCCFCFLACCAVYRKKEFYTVLLKRTIVLYLHIFKAQNYIISVKISASGLFLKYSRKFSKFQRRYSYKLYSYKQEIERVYCPCSSAGEISLIKEVILNLYHHYVL